LLTVYREIGYSDRTREKAEATRQQTIVLCQEIAVQIQQLMVNSGATVAWLPGDSSLLINDEYSIEIRILRHLIRVNDKSLWKMQFRAERRTDLTVLVRLDQANLVPLDYYLLPRGDAPACMTVVENKRHRLDGYRYPTLDHLVQLAGRSSIRRPA
jgi:hypothetical protein